MSSRIQLLGIDGLYSKLIIFVVDTVNRIFTEVFFVVIFVNFTWILSKHCLQSISLFLAIIIINIIIVSTSFFVVVYLDSLFTLIFIWILSSNCNRSRPCYFFFIFSRCSEHHTAFTSENLFLHSSRTQPCSDQDVAPSLFSTVLAYRSGKFFPDRTLQLWTVVTIIKILAHVFVISCRILLTCRSKQV